MDDEEGAKMKMLSAKAYAAHSGYPLSTVKQYCNEGILPHERRGRLYYINIDLADAELIKRQTAALKPPPLQDKQPKPTFNYLEALKQAAKA